jgi:hypothetical protein
MTYKPLFGSTFLGCLLLYAYNISLIPFKDIDLTRWRVNQQPGRTMTESAIVVERKMVLLIKPIGKIIRKRLAFRHYAQLGLLIRPLSHRISGSRFARPN